MENREAGCISPRLCKTRKDRPATWYILPVREVENRQMLMFRPKGYRRPDIYAHYREAWHLLREPDGLIFGLKFA